MKKLITYLRHLTYLKTPKPIGYGTLTQLSILAVAKYLKHAKCTNRRDAC